MGNSRTRPKKLRRRNKPQWLIVLIAFVTALSTTAVGTRLGALRQDRQKTMRADIPIPLNSKLEMITLPMPTRSVARGEKIADVPLTSVKWPKSRVSREYVASTVGLKNAVATNPLSQFAPIPIGSISHSPIDRNAVIESIPQGMRAITIRVDAEAAVEGWARSGSRIDVILIRNGSDRSEGLEANVIAENVRIISAGRSTTPLSGSSTAPKAPATVTLLVTQDDALKIKTASRIGKLTFALRGAKDESPTRTKAMNQGEVLGKQKSRPTTVIYEGYARTSDGKTYALTQERRWVRTNIVPKTLRQNFATMSGRRSSSNEKGDANA